MGEHKVRSLLILVILFLITISNYDASYANEKYQTIKVGAYDLDPDFYIKPNGKVEGYYKEILDNIIFEINKNLPIDKRVKVEYVRGSIHSLIEDLEENKIDLMIGLQYTNERKDKLIFSKENLGVDLFGIYANKDYKYKDIKSINNKKVAFIKSEYGSKWLLDELAKNGIKPKPVWVEDFNQIIDMLKHKSVVAAVAPINQKKLRGFEKIYEFSPGPAYIASSKNNKWIIDEIDNVLQKPNKNQKHSLEKIYLKYFHKGANSKEIIILCTIALICILFILVTHIIPAIKLKKLRKSIKENLSKNRYTLYYQPIINPKNDKVVGFEALIRYINPDGKIISPYFFLGDIEKCNMTEELSIWIFKTVLKDYKWFKTNTNLKGEEFYISLNISFNEIRSKEFLEKVNYIIDNDKDFKSKKIVFEIVENIKSDNFKQIKKGMEFLQSRNIKIAADDFGIQYSNLDILSTFNFDVVKIDKYFIDEIREGNFNYELIVFLSKICKLTNTKIIAEGVESKDQVDILKNIDNDNIFIQGYFYAQPQSKEEIELINNMYKKYNKD